MYKSHNYNNTSNSSILKSTQDNTINHSMLSIHQTQSESIQREIDNYTAKLQQQKRKFFSIQDTHKETLKEYETIKQKLQESKRLSQTCNSIIAHTKLKTLKGNFDKMRVAYDETIAYNYKLKTEIDRLRRDKKILLNLQNTYVAEIETKENKYYEKLQQIEQKKQKNQGILRQIDEIKTLNDQEKNDCTRRIQNIQNQYTQSKKFRQLSKMNEKTLKAEIIDTYPVLKIRLKKIIAKNKETVKSLDKYQKNLSMIEAAFEQIKNGSGVQDLDQITETFVKMNEQNASLYKYADSISKNIRDLEDYNNALAKRIQQQTQINRQKLQESKNPSAKQLRKKHLQQQLKQKEQYIQNFNKLLSNIHPELEKTLLYLANSRWNLEPTKAEDYKLDFTVNDLTIEQYLSDLQKFSNSIIEVCHLRKSGEKGSLIQQYTSETGKYITAPVYSVEEGREEKDKEILVQKQLKKFAQEYISTQKRFKQKQ